MRVILIIDVIQLNVTLFSHLNTLHLVNRSVRMLDPVTCKSYQGNMLLQLAQIVSMLLIDNRM